DSTLRRARERFCLSGRWRARGATLSARYHSSISSWRTSAVRCPLTASLRPVLLLRNSDGASECANLLECSLGIAAFDPVVENLHVRKDPHVHGVRARFARGS